MTTRRGPGPSLRAMSGGSRTAIHEFAAALERADASARVLGARALAARHGAGPAAAFSALAGGAGAAWDAVADRLARAAATFEASGP